MKIRVLLVDDQSLFRDGISMLLSRENDIEVVASVGDGDEALDAARACRPHVVLMDLKMKRVDGVEATRRILRNMQGVSVLMLTTYDEDQLIFEALAEGAVGYLLKDSKREEIAESIREAAAGKSTLNPTVARKLVDEFARISHLVPDSGRVNDTKTQASLSSRELEVLRLVSRGANNKEIAASLYVAEGTVKNHLTNIFRKIDVSDRLQAAIWARRQGIH